MNETIKFCLRKILQGYDNYWDPLGGKFVDELMNIDRLGHRKLGSFEELSLCLQLKKIDFPHNRYVIEPL